MNEQIICAIVSFFVSMYVFYQAYVIRKMSKHLALHIYLEYYRDVVIFSNIFGTLLLALSIFAVATL